MTKAKLYCPETTGTFVMMFGFKQPTKFKRKKRNYEKKL